MKQDLLSGGVVEWSCSPHDHSTTAQTLKGNIIMANMQSHHPTDLNGLNT